MKFSKEEWWEYIKETELSGLGEPDLLELLQQVFYIGYTCRDTEPKIIGVQLEEAVKVLLT